MGYLSEKGPVPVTVEHCQKFIQEVAARIDGSDSIILDDDNTETFEVCFTKAEADRILKAMKTMWDGWDNQASLLETTKRKLRRFENDQ